jgi:hypothetical protein
MVSSELLIRCGGNNETVMFCNPVNFQANSTAAVINQSGGGSITAPNNIINFFKTYDYTTLIVAGILVMIVGFGFWWFVIRRRKRG